jgi:cytidylate kinase
MKHSHVNIYIVTLLYNAHEEYIIAQLNEKYEKTSSREEKKAKNQFQDYEQREYSDDQMKEFELRKLGVKKKK